MTTSLPPGQTVTINGMQMYYVLHGQGEPLVLLHGFTGSSSDWSLFFHDLASEYQLVIPDLRGHGQSTNPSMEFTFRQCALDVFALLDHLGIERFKAIGLSGQFTIESRTGEDWQFMRQSHKHGDEQIRAIWTHGQALKDSYDDMNFTTPYLSTIAARTLIVYGDRDPLYPVHIALEMYSAIPDSFTGSKEPFITTVLPFLRGKWEQE